MCGVSIHSFIESKPVFSRHAILKLIKRQALKCAKYIAKFTIDKGVIYRVDEQL